MPLLEEVDEGAEESNSAEMMRAERKQKRSKAAAVAGGGAGSKARKKKKRQQEQVGVSDAHTDKGWEGSVSKIACTRGMIESDGV